MPSRLSTKAAVHLMERSPLPIIVHQEGRLVYANAPALEFLRAEIGDRDPIGLDVFSFYPPEERQRAERNAEEILAKGRRVDNNRRTLIDSKGKRWTQIGSAIPVSWEGRPALEVSFVLIPQSDEPCVDEATADLTPRQKQIALLVAKSLSTVNIAQTLSLSEFTVRTHLRTIFRKMGVHSRTELISRMLGQT